MSGVPARTKAAAPAGKVALYEKLVATIPVVECEGATHPYTSVNGNMFSYLHPSGAMALRLPEDERVRFLQKYKTTLFQAYGIVQKEYVTVPDALLKKTGELKKYFNLSYRYAQTLKAKPARKSSPPSFLPERRHGIEPRGSPGRQIRREQRHGEQHQNRTRHTDGILRADTVQLAGDQT